METRDILILGSILLCCGCIGLLIVRLSNPFFKGLGWLGGTFAAGALGATAFNLNVNDPTGIWGIIADTLVLLAYVFLHVCILEVTENPPDYPRLGLILLAIQAAAYPAFQYVHRARQLSVVMLGVMLAIQALQSAAYLKKSARPGILPPIWFIITLLIGFASFNIFRSIAVLILNTPQDPHAPNPFEVTTAIVFLGVGLGIGFGIFWMTTAEMRLKLEQLAHIDPLTGLCNRRLFLSCCERESMVSSRTGEPFSLIVIDLDNFKQINDSFGHDTGDAALCAVVGKLRNGVRNIDVLGRWGGEEFVALLPGADSKAAIIVAQRLRQGVEALVIKWPSTKVANQDVPIAVTISLGVATYTSQADSIDELFRRCDRALYQAKADGRNRVVQASM